MYLISVYFRLFIIKLSSLDVADGSDDVERAYVDMMLDQTMDLRNGVVRLCYNKDYVRTLDVFVPLGS